MREGFGVHECGTDESYTEKQYKGAYKWVNRVNKMSDAQVIAVYYRMLYAHQLK